MAQSTYTWQINAMDSYPSHNGQSDVVFTVHWGCVGANTANANVSSYIYSTQSVVYEANTPFTPYANLTSNLVSGWVQSAMGPDSVNAVYAALDTRNDNIINPTQVMLPLPWNSANT